MTSCKSCDPQVAHADGWEDCTCSPFSRCSDMACVFGPDNGRRGGPKTFRIKTLGGLLYGVGRWGSTPKGFKWIHGTIDDAFRKLDGIGQLGAVVIDGSGNTYTRAGDPGAEE